MIRPPRDVIFVVTLAVLQISLNHRSLLCSSLIVEKNVVRIALLFYVLFLILGSSAAAEPAAQTESEEGHAKADPSKTDVI